MPEAQYISLIVVFLVVLVCAFIRYGQSRAPTQEKRYIIATSDLLAGTFLSCAKINAAPFTGFCVWTLISAVFCIYVPVFAGNNFIGNPFGFIVTIDYVIVVPMLVGSYLLLITSFSRLARPDALTRTGLHCDRSSSFTQFGFWTIVFQVILVAATLGIQYQAIQSEIDVPSPGEPWKEVGSQISKWGAAYYVLRGIDAYMALGLFAVVFTIWWILHQLTDCKDPRLLFTSGHKVQPEIRMLCTALVACLLLGTTITLLHGIALFIHAYAQSTEALRIRIFVGSTWILWVVLTILATAAGISIIFWFRGHLLTASEQIERQFAEDIDVQVDKVDASNIEYRQAYWSTKEKMEAFVTQIPTWPLPRAVGLTLIFSIGMQFFNIVSGAIAIFSSFGKGP